MNLNLTLLGQMLTFAILVWFTMRYIWPPLDHALIERKKKIADGLAAAERGVHELELAQHKALEYLRDAKLQAAEIIEQANKRSTSIIDEAKLQARGEGARLLTLAKAEINQELESAKQQLLRQVTTIAVQGAEKILEQNLSTAANQAIVEKLIGQI